MDNLTHSLAGAVLGQMGLKRKTALAMPTLIIAANIPDIDAFATVLGPQSLAIRRGITHGPIALMLLPILLTALMLLYARLRPNPARAPVHKGWLLALAYIGTLSHPALDWLNSYGIRFLEPFSSHWFAGDTIFIIDLWIWIALIASVWLSRRREKRGATDWQRPAWLGFTAICVYIAANGLITGRAEQHFHDAVPTATGGQIPTLVVANPVPVQFWKREMHWRNAQNYGGGSFAMFEKPVVQREFSPHNMIDPELVAAQLKDYPDARAYLFWSRMPIISVEGQGDGRIVVLRDQRFDNPMVSDNFTVKVPYKAP
jgi:inner membrane protein